MPWVVDQKTPEVVSMKDATPRSIPQNIGKYTEVPFSRATCPNFYAKICSLLARRQPVQRVYRPENVIDWPEQWRSTCVMRHARGHKLQRFRRE